MLRIQTLEVFREYAGIYYDLLRFLVKAMPAYSRLERVPRSRPACLVNLYPV